MIRDCHQTDSGRHHHFERLFYRHLMDYLDLPFAGWLNVCAAPVVVGAGGAAYLDCTLW